MNFKIISATLTCVVLAAAAHADNFLSITNNTNEEKCVGVTYRIKGSDEDIKKTATISSRQSYTFKEGNPLGVELKEIFFGEKGSEVKYSPPIMLGQGDDYFTSLGIGRYMPYMENNEEVLKKLDLSRPIFINKIGGVDLLFASSGKA